MSTLLYVVSTYEYTIHTSVSREHFGIGSRIFSQSEIFARIFSKAHCTVIYNAGADFIKSEKLLCARV
jgi:hypothetical protein